jgi:hypothetical protein
MGPIKTLSPLGPVSAWPQVASDDDGDSAVVWEQDGRVVGRRMSATGSVGTLRTLSTTSALNPLIPSPRYETAKPRIGRRNTRLASTGR